MIVLICHIGQLFTNINFHEIIVSIEAEDASVLLPFASKLQLKLKRKGRPLLHTKSNMNLEKIEKIAHDEMASRITHQHREPGWILYHGIRTGKIACHLVRKIGLDEDPDALYVAGLFHDIGKGKDYHNEVGAKRTHELLSNLIPKKILDTICEMIQLHNQRKHSANHSNLAKLIQDADLIDHTGLIDIWLSLYWSGNRNETIQDHLKWFKGKDFDQWRDYMRNNLNFDVSRQILEDRIQKSDQMFVEFHNMYFNGI